MVFLLIVLFFCKIDQIKFIFTLFFGFYTFMFIRSTLPRFKVDVFINLNWNYFLNSTSLVILFYLLRGF